MKRLALGLAAFMLSTALAHAVTVTLTVGNKTFSTTVTAQNAARFTAWATAAYPTIPNPAFNPEKPQEGSNTPTIPNPDPVISAFKGVWEGLKNNVLSFEKEKGIEAVPAPAPID